MQHDGGAAEDGGVVGVRCFGDGRVFDEDGAAEREERCLGEVDDDDLGRKEETSGSSPRGRRRRGRRRRAREGRRARRSTRWIA
jgi:hypothetical protein